MGAAEACRFFRDGLKIKLASVFHEMLCFFVLQKKNGFDHAFGF